MEIFNGTLCTDDIYNEIKFEKVSFEQFCKDIIEPVIINEVELKTGVKTVEGARKLYDNIKLPRRATKGSAGYDFFAVQPYEISNIGEALYIATGIKVKMPKGVFLSLQDRSSIVTYKGLSLVSPSQIDHDFSPNISNAGHVCPFIVKKFLGINESIKGAHTVNRIEAGTALFQGVFVPYLWNPINETFTKERTGGYGSTDK